MKRRNFIFDLGNILIEWNKDKILKAILSENEVPLFDTSIFQSGLWENLDAGMLSIEELEEKLVEILGIQHKPKIQEILWNCPDYVETYPEIYRLIAEIKQKGHAVYMLSNTSPLFYSVLDKQLLDLRPLLDGFVISCEVKKMKPSEEIYQHLVKKYHLAVEKSFFFDDLVENVEGAKKVGIVAFQISNQQELKEKLLELM